MLYTKVDCPYCKAKNVVSVAPQFTDTVLIACDVENGGCDNIFAVKTELKIAATVYMVSALKES